VEIIDFLSKLNKILCNIEQLPIPVIAALDGIALGGGLEMSLSCDIRVASKSTKIGLVETKLGIIPGAGGTQRLSRIVGPAVAKELIYTGRIVDGTQAYNLGIVNHIVDQNENEDAAYQKSLQIANEIASNGPIAVKLAKRAINIGLQVDLSSGLEIEKALYAQLLPTKDRIEGYSAFLEKRQPKYTGE
ncbi:methylglutaconyl-CoA hydratase, mitochondrial, partial [Agrilus planipennis]|uniref:Methylglutaconyl-CoA hydratase, mitochondrial n=1 Tax=Agrilus planipennis TaxID=224129 RepID=A0A7F5RIT8_AGRPL